MKEIKNEKGLLNEKNEEIKEKTRDSFLVFNHNGYFIFKFSKFR